MSQKKLQQHIWPSMRGNERNTGCSMHDLELKKDASVRYYHTGNGIFSTPIIDGHERIFVGSADKNFYAIDSIQNNVRWKFKTKGVIDSAACLDKGGSLYVPSGDASLYKLSPEGEKKWECNVLEKKYPRISTIFWWEGNVAIGPNGFIYAGNDDFCFYALDSEGNVQWSFAAGLHIWSAPAFYNGLVYIASFDMCVYALNQDTGTVVWKRCLKNFIASSPAVDENGNVYIASFDGSVYALEGTTGKIKWRVKTKKSIYSSVAIAPDGMVFAGSGDGSVYCINARKGRIVWSVPMGSPVWSSISIGKDPEKKEPYLVYAGTSNGMLAALTPSGGFRWTYYVRKKSNYRRAGINASLALGKSGLALGTTDGNVVYVPYHFYKDNLKEIGISQNRESFHNHSLDSDGMQLDKSFSIGKMEFTMPEIINPLDQIGIASLNIEVGVVRKDPDSERFVAWGIETVGVKEDAQGIPYVRRHLYAFNGLKKEDSFTLETKRCNFDITAFPVPLDNLSFRCKLDNGNYLDNSFIATLDCNHILRKVLNKYRNQMVSYAIGSIKKIWTQSRGTGRLCLMLWHLVAKKSWKSLGLIDESGYFQGKGIFEVTPLSQYSPSLHFQEVLFHKKSRCVVAKFFSGNKAMHQDYPGILLVRKNPLEVVNLDYEKSLSVKESGDTITATLTIPKNVDISSGVEAIILVNTSMQAVIDL